MWACPFQQTSVWEDNFCSCQWRSALWQPPRASATASAPSGVSGGWQLVRGEEGLQELGHSLLPCQQLGRRCGLSLRLPQVPFMSALLGVVLAQGHSSLARHQPSSCNPNINCWRCYIIMFIKHEKQCLDCTFSSSSVFSKAISQTVLISGERCP